MKPTIYNFLLIHKQSGIVLTEVTFNKLPNGYQIDDVLIGGLFSSINAFSQEVFGEQLQLIQTPSFQIIFTFDEKFYFAVIMEHNPHIKVAEKILTKIKANFKDRYLYLFEQGAVNDTKLFEGFKEFVEGAVGLKGIHFMRYLKSHDEKLNKSEFKKEFDQLLEHFHQKHHKECTEKDERDCVIHTWIEKQQNKCNE